MSSLGSQWRVIRHYLSLNNLNSELEKLVQKLKPVTPEQWESLINKLENSIPTKLRESQKSSSTSNVLKATTIDETASKSKEVATVEKPKDKDIAESDKTKPESQSVGYDISFESIWQGLKLTKDLHFGKISEPSWKSNKPKVSKTSIHSRTAYVVSALATAEGECLKKRTEGLVDHLLQYPEARELCYQGKYSEGAIRALLRVQHRLPVGDEVSEHVRGVVNEKHMVPTRWRYRPYGEAGNGCDPSAFSPKSDIPVWRLGLATQVAGRLKSKIYANQPRTVSDLKRNIQSEIENISP
ncbi:hypothetical protein ACJJTC_016444 [Scirpophaga incertulas]